ncbi:MAG: lanthionine synthetase LanC family protein [Pseudomonadota bacterium]
MSQDLNANTLLEVAQGAEQWINTLSHSTPNGQRWGLAAERPDKFVPTLYLGSAGIALFYLELYQATQDNRYLKTAMAAGDDVIAQIPELNPTCAPMGGWTGYMFFFNELYKHSNANRFMEAASLSALKQRESATGIGAGIGWIQEMPYAKLTGHSGVREIFDMTEGAAGAGTFWLYAHDEKIHAEALSWAVAAGERLLEVAETAEGGRRWQLMPDIPYPFDAPNFAHGTAGVAYFMARLYECTREQKYLDAAIDGATHVQAVAEEIPGGGHLVPHVLDDGRPNRFYLGLCHGPPGTARLFYLLTELTGESAWCDWGKGLDQGLVSIGAPEERSKGFWNNISQCCCDAGIGDHAVNMYRLTNDPFYKDLALRVANQLIKSAKVEDGHYSWPQAEHRTQKDFIQAQTGYMQGAAGVGSFFVHLATTMNDAPVKIQFPDSPFSRLD